MISTSHVARQNLTSRMGMRRFTRRTNWFSNRLENHLHMLSLYFLRMDETQKCTPDMAAGACNELHDMTWLLGVIDAAAPAPEARAVQQKQVRAAP